MAKYKKCPFCNYKNLNNSGICPKCNRLLDSQLSLKKVSPPKRKNYKFILSFIKLFILFFLVYISIIFIKNNYLSKTAKKPDTYQEESFIEIVDNIKYNPDYIENKLIPVKDYSSSEPFKLINKNGQIVMDNIINYIADYNSFHIITKKNNNKVLYYIVNNNGDILYKTISKINYYPSTNTWIIGDKLYNNKKLIKENIRIEDNNYLSGYYFPFVDDKEQGIINYEGIISYKSEIQNYNHFTLETTNYLSLKEDNYCLINDNYTYLVINCNTGNILINGKNKKIYELAPNVYYKDNLVFYINKKGDIVSLKVDSDLKNLYVEYLDDNKIIIDKFVYDLLTGEKYSINELDLHSLNSKNVEQLLNTQKEYCLNITELNFGLKYNNQSIIPCENDNITYYNKSVIETLLSHQKIYVIISNYKNNSLYDVKNNKILISNIVKYSPYSIFLEYKEADKYYIYNIITNEKIEVSENASLELHSNYFMIEKYTPETTSTIREYYDYDFKNIYLGK